MSLPYEITASLLLSKPAKTDFAKLQQALEARLAHTPMRFEQRQWRLAPVLSAGNLHLVLQARDLPMPSGRLETALASRMPALMREDIAGTIARHRAALTVTVGVGPEPSHAADEAPSQERFDQMLIVAHTAITRLARDCQPLALYWSQSEQLVSAQRLLALSEMLFPLPLFLHPQPIQRTQGDTTWLALDIRGAEHLIGRPLRTDPAPVDFNWMMQRVLAYVSHLRAGGKAVGEGKAFAMADGERFTVHHDPDGGLRLSLDEFAGAPVHRPDAALFSTAA